MGDERHAPFLRGSTVVYRVLLVFYPRGFRRAYQEEAVQLFRDRYRAAHGRRGVAGIVSLWLRTLPNVVVHGLLERAGEIGRGFVGLREGVWLDVDFALRRLVRERAFTVVAILSLAVGIGASTALFSLFYGVLVRPLPYPDADRLVRMREVNSLLGQSAGPSPLNFAEWDERTGPFEAMGAWYLTSGTYRDEAHAEELRSAQVTAGFFRTLGGKPSLGRIPEAEDVRGYGPIVLSDALWRRLFDADSRVIGRVVTISGERYEIAAVMPAGFRFPDASVETWILWNLRDVYADRPESRSWRFLGAVGRLRPGVTLEAARPELNAWSDALARAYPAENAGWRIELRSLHDEVVGAARPALRASLGAVALLLLMACVNVANLLLAQAPTRQRELALRHALGAGKYQLTRLLALENLLLSLCGGVAGLLVAALLLRLLVVFDAGAIPRLADVRIDGLVLAFAAGVSVLGALLFGSVPSLSLTRGARDGALWSNGRRSIGSSAHARFRQAFVVGQVAVAVVLLAGAALFLNSFERLRRVDPGFDPHGVLTFRISLDPLDGAPGTTADYWDGLLTRLAAIPGVAAVGAAQTLPLHAVGNDFTRPYRRPGETTPAAEAATAQMRIVTPGYFDAVGMRRLAGRGPSNEDRAGQRRVVVVNRTLAATLWPGRPAVDERIELEFRDGWQPYDVIGVVADTRHYGLREGSRPEVFLSHRQAPYLAMSVALRGDVRPEQLLPAVRAAVLEHRPAQPAHAFTTLEQALGESIARDRFLLVLMATFGAVALLLATCGVYGVVAHAVSRRTPEIGMRIALGARPAAMVRDMIIRSTVLAGIGAGIGLVTAVLLGRSVASLLYDVRPTDPPTLAAATALLLLIASIAAYLPARRAARIDPAEALRGD